MENKKVFDIVGKRNILFAIPIAIAFLAVLFTVIFGLQVDIEFKGGTILTYSYTGELGASEVESVVEGLGHGLVTVTKGSSFGTNLETLNISFASNEGLTADVQNEISDKLLSSFADNTLNLENSKDVNPSTGGTFFLKCLVAVLFSFILLIIYIAGRFKKIGGLSAGAFALVALFHDLIIVYSSFVFFRLPIDANFMAVILTILGYSINNTIIIYDRVRENRTLFGKKIGLAELVNLSIKQTLTRTLNTTLTTLFSVVSIAVVSFAFGVTSIISFALPLMIGLIAGTYSSVCISGPLWVLWQQYKEKKLPSKAKKKV